MSLPFQDLKEAPGSVPGKSCVHTDKGSKRLSNWSSLITRKQHKAKIRSHYDSVHSERYR